MTHKLLLCSITCLNISEITCTHTYKCINTISTTGTNVDKQIYKCMTIDIIQPCKDIAYVNN